MALLPQTFNPVLTSNIQGSPQLSTQAGNGAINPNHRFPNALRDQAQLMATTGQINPATGLPFGELPAGGIPAGGVPAPIIDPKNSPGGVVGPSVGGTLQPIPQIQQDALSQSLPVAGGAQSGSPLTGLLGSESILGNDIVVGRGRPLGIGIGGGGGSGASSADILGQIRSDIGQGVSRLDHFTGAGIDASREKAAFAGLLGPEAQQQALDNIVNSPALAFLQEQGLRRTRADSAATGGLGGGNIQRELSRFNQGLASQKIGDQINLLGQIEQTGLGASRDIAGLFGQQAGLGSSAQTALAGQASNRAIQGASIGANVAMQQASLNAQRQNTLASQRFQTGLQQSSNIGNITNALSQLQSSQGRGISDITGQAGTNIANLLLQSGLNQAQIQQGLGAAVGNVASGAGTQLAQLGLQGGAAQAAGILGQGSAQAQGAADISGILAALIANQAGTQ